ncbi:MAG: glutamate mutase L [Caldilineaceae bacterium]|nr:glutamate mutase L [Caldilineaceae bacterium]
MSQSDLQPAPAPGRASATPSLADFAPKNILLLGAEPRRATAALIEPVEEIYRLMGWQSTDLPADASPGQCAAALVQAVNRLENQFDISLWSEEEDRPRLHTYDPALVKGVGQAVAVADLLPPLRVWMAGLSGGTSLIASRDALAGALCNCVATYRYSPWRSTDELAAELELLRPDVILAVGGYQETDRRGQEQVLALCRHVIDAAVKLPFEDRPLFCFAGNRQSAQAALGYWHGRTEGSAAVLAANVLAPDAGQRDTALARVLEQHHWQRSQQMPAMRRIAGWLNHAPELRSTQWAFVQAVRLWARHHRLTSLHGLYAAADRWLHVWTTGTAADAGREGQRQATGPFSPEGAGLRLCCVRPGERPDFLAGWPALRLVSGPWPEQWPRPVSHWWDPLGLVPVVAGAGQVAPEASLQVLSADILEETGPPLRRA